MNQDSGYTNVTPEDFLDHEGVEYRRTSGSRGPQFNIRECPLCGGTAWKVYLGVETGYGNCFHGSCGANFNLWTFAKALIGTDDSSVVGKRFDEIAGKAGWKPKPKKVEATPAIAGQLKLPMSVPIPNANGENVEYLETRGVTSHLARKFGLRNCINGVFEYAKEDGTPGRMVFTGRIIIPINDLDGSLVTFQGRDITGQSDRKYLFPPRLPSTARFLYNGHRAFAERWEHAVMGEGAFDVIATQAAIEGDLTAFPDTGAIGSFGKKLTLDFEPGMPTQLQALLALKANGLKRITILWDGERAALVAALKTARKLRGYGFEAFIGFLPKGKDPAEVTAALVRKAIRTALPYSMSLETKVRLRNPYG